MAVNTNATKLANLVNPQVMADLVDTKLVDAIKFSPLATIGYELVGRPGDTLTLPRYTYIGTAEVVTEGNPIPIKKLVADTDTVQIHKVGVGVELTDEALLSGFGNPEDEAASQIALSIGTKVDNEMLVVLEGIASGMTFAKTTETTFADVANNALELFGEDIDGVKILMVAPAQATELRKAESWLPASEIAADIRIKGVVGEVEGCQVMVSNKLKTKNEAFIVKPGALRVELKRDLMLETDRDIINKSTIMTADKHCVSYLYDASKAIKITLA